MKCRFYSEELPRMDEVVMVKVKRIEDTGVYVELLEYNNAEGLVILAEISRKRIRSIYKIVKMGQVEPMIVTRVDETNGYIDLSKRRVTPEDIVQCREKYSHACAVNSLLSHVAHKVGSTTDEELMDLYTKTAWRFDEQDDTQGGAYHMFKKALSSPEILDECGLEEETRTELLDEIKKRMGGQMFKLEVQVDVSCYGYEGILGIQKALLAGRAMGTEQAPIQIHLIAFPSFNMRTTCLDKKQGIETLTNALKAIENAITQIEGGVFKQPGPIKVDSNEDENNDKESDDDNEEDSEEEE